MPSSVFQCISVFQVYFGVYTDPPGSLPGGVIFFPINAPGMGRFQLLNLGGYI